MPKEDTQFKPGQSGNPKGKPKGARDKVLILMDAFLDTFNRLEKNDGGLYEWAKANRITKADFYKLVAKMLPSKIEHSGNVDINPHLGEVTLKVVNVNGKDENDKPDDKQ